mmetsp:Transcript_36326/g.104614  ORF Transcript_36326/g.104614 Transcript_36326/m.104614 type:complete len:308 (-) Transcript_36326:236-1159(-)
MGNAAGSVQVCCVTRDSKIPREIVTGPPPAPLHQDVQAPAVLAAGKQPEAPAAPPIFAGAAPKVDSMAPPAHEAPAPAVHGTPEAASAVPAAAVKGPSAGAAPSEPAAIAEKAPAAVPDKSPAETAAKAPAATMALAPAKVDEPPAKVDEPPAKVAEEPAVVAEAPAKVAEAPAKAAEPEVAQPDTARGIVKRRDPETGKVVTLVELHAHYSRRFSPREITEYWNQHCQPVRESEWVIIGGADKGGILVREGKDLKSKELARLSTGAKIRELARDGERMQFKLIAGLGPATGWISTVVKGKDMIMPA